MKMIVQLTGSTPLVQHNIRLADKQDEYTKAIAQINAKRKKTESDALDVEKLEWFGGLYHDPGMGVYVPAFSVIRSFEEAAKVTRHGKDVVRAIILTADKLPLRHDGPATPDALWKLGEFRFRATVGIGTSKITRMRPIFRRWSLDLEAEFLEDVINPDDLRGIIALAGRAEGIGDARKLGYGRFVTEIVMSEVAA